MFNLWERHHIPPCVGMGWAAPTEKWCPGCVVFIQVAEEVQYDLDQEAARRARSRR